MNGARVLPMFPRYSGPSTVAATRPARYPERMNDEQARQRLEEERQRLTGLIREVRHELDDEIASESSELAHVDQHPADSATDTFEREKDLSILDGLEAELAEIEAAIERIDAGTYGIDEVTGEPIDPARLDARPEARTNVTATPPPSH